MDNSDINYVNDWVKKFEKFYFQTRQRNYQTETTWKIDYLRVFSKLPQQEALSEEMILKAVTGTKPDTKTRKRTCMALSSLAKFAEIDINLKSYVGRYSPKKVVPRDLPTDTIVAQHFYQIEDEAWRWVYGMLATYGLRNHEVFRLDQKRDRSWRLYSQCG